LPKTIYKVVLNKLQATDSQN